LEFGKKFIKPELYVVTKMTSSVFEKQKLQIIRTHSKITQIKQEKTQSYISL
jgi:hypothetical protein